MMLRIQFYALCLAFPVITLAQGESDSIRHIREVVVVGNRYREVIPSQRLSGQELEALSSFSVADAIRYFSGVQIKDYGGVGGLKTVDIRSMGTHHMGVFYDGIQLGNAQNGQIDLGRFSLDNLEEISLYNGQKSEIFQPAKDFGSAGTIYLRTRRPRFVDGKTSRILSLFRTGSFGLVNPSLLWERKISSRGAANEVAASINAEYIYASGKYPFRYRKVLHDGTVAWDTTAIRRNGDIRSFRLEGGIYGLAGDGQWHAKAYFYDSEKGIPGAIVNNLWKRSQRQWDRSFFAQGSLRKQMSRRYDLLVSLKYARDRMRYLNPDTTLMYVDNTFLQQELYASLANKFALRKDWEVNLSADYQWNQLEASLQDFAYPRRHTVLLALATAFEWKRLKGQASLLGTFVSESVRPPAVRPPRKEELTPALFFSWKPSEADPLQARAFYKRIFRMPTFNDLYYTDVGNIALRPEYTTQYNIGLQRRTLYERRALRSLEVRADVYYNEVSDKIIAVPKGNGQYRWMMMNIGYVKIRGIDISAQAHWDLPREIRLQAHLSYTWQRAQDFSDPTDNDPRAGSYKSQIAYIPRHSGSAILNATRRSWDVNYSFIYVGERYHNSSNIRENYEPSWYTHDLTIGKAFVRKNLQCKLSAEVNNLLNQYYDVVLNYPMPGRNYKLILKIDL